MSPFSPTIQRRSSAPKLAGGRSRMTRFRRSASRFEYAITRSCSANRTALAATAKSSSGAAARYRLMPQARMTTSSLFFVIRPTVTSVATSAAIGMM